jgi:hypothetical protein
MTYQMTVSDLQRLVDAIANLTRSGLPGTVSQLTIVTSAHQNCTTKSCGSVRDLVTRVEGNGLA